MKREAEFTTKFKKWMKLHTQVPACGAYEVKVTPNKRIPFDAVKPHQIEALLAVKNGCFIFKIPDAGWQNPFDVIMMASQPAYVVLAFTELRQKTKTYIVDIELFLEMQTDAEEFGVKSVSQEFLGNYCAKYPTRCQCHSI